MDNETLIRNIDYLVNKYVPERKELVEMLTGDIDACKYVLAEINRNKNKNYDEKDSELLKDIAFYYL